MFNIMDVHRQFSCVLVGEGALLLSCADLLVARGHAVEAISCSDALIRRYAAERGIRWIDPVSDLSGALGDCRFDYLFSVANLSILSKNVLKLPRYGAINFHDSLLPAYAGVHATSWALIDQVTEHGITWHSMTGELDCGDIYKQWPVTISAHETAFSLNKKCIEAGLGAFAELTGELASGRQKRKRQDLSQRSYFSKFMRPVDAGILSWSRSALDLDALFRALDFGPTPNPLCTAKAKIGADYYTIGSFELLSTQAGAAPGTVLQLEEEGIPIGTLTHDVRIGKFTTLEGEIAGTAQVVARANLRSGSVLSEVSADLKERINAQAPVLARHEAFWRERLASLRPLDLGQSESRIEVRDWACARLQCSAELERCLAGADVPDAREWLLAAFGAFAHRMTDEAVFDVAFRNECVAGPADGLDGLLPKALPVRIEVRPEGTVRELAAGIREELASVRRRQSYWRDLLSREPGLANHGRASGGLSVAVQFGPDELADTDNAALVVRIGAAPLECEWMYERNRLSEDVVGRLMGQWSAFLNSAALQPDRPIGDLALLSDAESKQLLSDWNDTAQAIDGDLCKHELFEAEAKRNPERVALVFGDQQLTYRELNARANQLARHLRALGVGPDVLVGICMKRSIEMVVALLAVFKAGGAYVPLDPGYPGERIAFMLEDSSAPVLLTQRRLVSRLPDSAARVVCVDADWPAIAQHDTEDLVNDSTPANLAYVMYTSGSTGTPKGVMVEHRNVVNFFTGMDRVLGGEAPGTWLAVTSISFDISVLELFWTLTRGFKVILQPELASRAEAGPSKTGRAEGHPLHFSLFYFASDEGGHGTDKYRLLLEGARFADANGFEAVWTPERHFHAFGGLYPNPSVTGAALAAITERIQIRAGSVVLPLHHPIRVAEEWAVVDNLSRGRIGISFASGWQANDFVLAPERYAKSKQLMFQGIETVRKLWRGEPVFYPNGKGEEVAVKILPRPVQRELPVWITAAGNPETFRAAGEAGANLLTHLLGQSVAALAEKIQIYREAWRNSGRPGQGYVTIMLHTFVGESIESVRETVRKPFSDYLRSSVDLIKNAPSAFPTFAKNRPPSKALDEAMQSGNFDQADLEALVGHAFDRYFETSALFGTPESCMGMIAQLKEIGVDEVACLIDFGVDAQAAMEGLKLLNEVRQLSEASAGTESVSASVPEQILKHDVTHLQCTPSMARMILADPDGQRALGSLRTLCVGGEPLPLALAQELGEIVQGDICNLYGPTETTVWSTVAPVGKGATRVHIGRPIANTQVYVLDGRFRPVPIGVLGELFIGGAGVARGYWKRPELTAERFVSNPFAQGECPRLYRTGDAVRYLEDGNIEFLGRLDNQVKIRGHRIELQEIENALEGHPEVRQAVVAAPDEPVRRLVGYVVPEPGRRPSVNVLRSFLQQKLPEFMVPELLIALEAMPLTPNGKVNRRALPVPESARPDLTEDYAAPRTQIEQELARIWQSELGLERAGIHDNFFNLGGNSLLAVQIAFRIRQAFQIQLPLHAFFDRPTIAALAADLEQKIMDQADEAKLEELLAEIEGLSEQELVGGAG